MDEAVSMYLQSQPEERRARLGQIRASLVETVKGTNESMRYRMPSYEKRGHWVCLANQKHHVAVYFCSESLIEDLKEQFPELSFGKACVRIRDTQDVPFVALKRAFRKAFSRNGKAG